MEIVLLDNIQALISNEEIFKKLRMDANDEYASEVLELAERAKNTAKHLKLYMEQHILMTEVKTG